MIFSRLEKDQKTFDLIIIYTGMIKSGCSDRKFFDLACELQAKEIERHNEMNGFGSHDPYQSNLWIAENHRKFRVYLNAIHFVACIVHGQKLVKPRLKINKDFVFWVIDMFDTQIQDHLNDIY